MFAQFYVGLRAHESEENHGNYMIAGRIYPIIDTTGVWNHRKGAENCVAYRLD
jgi:hypothetical protein